MDEERSLIRYESDSLYHTNEIELYLLNCQPRIIGSRLSNHTLYMLLPHKPVESRITCVEFGYAQISCDNGMSPGQYLIQLSAVTLWKLTTPSTEPRL